MTIFFILSFLKKSSESKIQKIVNFFKNDNSIEIAYDCPIFFHSFLNKKKMNNNYFFRENKWPKFPPTSCLSFKKDSLKKYFKKIEYKNLSELWFDFRISTFYALKRKQFNLINENLTFYRQNSYNYEKRYKKFLNKAWWKRRYQAFIFLKKINRNKFSKNIFTLDYLLTLTINKLFIN